MHNNGKHSDRAKIPPFTGSATLVDFDIREPVDVLAGVKNFKGYPHKYYK